MKNYLKLDHKKKLIIMDRTFAKASLYVGSVEYNMLQTARKDYPMYTVTTRTITRNKNQEHYKGLTYEYMENYINTHANAAAIMKEYREKRLQAECHSIRYPHIKQWFLAMYPELVDFSNPDKELSTAKVCEFCPNVAA